MKALFVITSIILLSFQIDRLLVSNLFETGNNIELLNHFVTGNHRAPSSLHPAPATRVQTSTADVSSLAGGVKTTAVAEKNSLVKIRSTYRDQSVMNGQLHQSIKLSGNYLEMATLQFGFNQSKKEDTRSFNAILQMADLLIFNDSLRISIAGFTDNVGAMDYNKQLSMRRALDVKQYLLDLGVNDNQIMVSGNGYSNPVADNSTGKGRAANRRVEMMLIR
ncbi:MAG TPA: OmpA family protein [Agriterribacter sp.]|nr:OmpA family protein [Agriterribacter sp.]